MQHEIFSVMDGLSDGHGSHGRHLTTLRTPPPKYSILS